MLAARMQTPHPQLLTPHETRSLIAFTSQAVLRQRPRPPAGFHDPDEPRQLEIQVRRRARRSTRPVGFDDRRSVDACAVCSRLPFSSLHPSSHPPLPPPSTPNHPPPPPPPPTPAAASAPTAGGCRASPRARWGRGGRSGWCRRAMTPWGRSRGRNRL